MSSLAPIVRSLAGRASNVRASARRAIVLALALCAGPAVASVEIAPLRIATEGSYPPFNYVDANQQVQGFEIEIGRALCERMGAVCTFVTEDWERLIPGLKHRRYDAIMASLEITEDRRRRVAFTRPYYRTPAVFMGRKNAPAPRLDLDGLRGQRIGAMAGTPYAAWLEDRLGPQAAVRLYANQDEASLDLALGRIDLVLGDKIALQEWLRRGKEADCCAFVGDAPRDPEHFGEGYGVAVRKDDAALLRRFEAALDAIVADGTYDRIRAGYFPFDVR